MAGTGPQGHGHAADGEGGGDGDACCFVWDDSSQLYYHASSGFYHDPEAGWYYSTGDGIYYRYENGQYLPWQSDEKGEADWRAAAVSNAGEIQVQSGNRDCSVDEGLEGPCPPSEWLEETLINLYLRGYSTDETSAGCSSTLRTDGDRSDALDRLVEMDDRCGDHDLDKFNEDVRNIAEDVGEPAESNDNFWDEDTSMCEENWLAQYGQVIKSDDENLLPFPVVDLWDWRLVKECGKKTKKVSRLVGRLVTRSMKLHPSMPAGGAILKTARICEVHLDLVQVATGKIYRLRSPSLEYLSLLSHYDSSNPTKDWDFPRLNIESSSLCTAIGNDPAEASNSVLRTTDESASSCQPDSAFGKRNYAGYRDRAAERRALHGSFGIGPGERISSNDTGDNGHAFSESSHTIEPGMGGINVPFGAQNYGRRVLESMGWKEGEALGRSKKGLLQPLQVVGNKGSAGLGWNTERPIM